MNTLWYNCDLKQTYYKLYKSSLIPPPTKRYKLSQDDFTTGTYRIIQPGYYQLTEDIVFHPNPDNQFNPTKEQFRTEVYSKMHYRLGFFAAITVETNNVIIDLNDFSISQSPEHYIHQRFYAHIEFASSPFIPNTGPANFGSSIKIPSNVILKNGTLGLTSHHGCHGNHMSTVLIYNVTFKDFEVAAISFNAGIHIYLKNLSVLGTMREVSSLGMMSQFIFDLPFLHGIQQKYPEATLSTKYETITIDTIVKSIETELQSFRNDPSTYTGILKNTTGLPDSNAYGIVFNSKGPVVGPLKSMRDEYTIGNQYIYIDNVNIHNIESDSIEINGYGPINGKQEAYGKDQYVGPIGDVIPLESVLDENGYYIGNLLTHMQLIINKYGIDKSEKGTCNVPLRFIHDLENYQKPIQELMEIHQIYCIKGKDTMGHHMKGNIGLFISQGNYVMIKNCTIDGVINHGTNPEKESSESSGILLTGTNHLVIYNQTIRNIYSQTGKHEAIRRKHENNNVIIK